MKTPHTPQITVSANVRYQAEESDEQQARFVFSYTITIHNTGDIAAKLLRRHWIITDSHHRVQEVHGDGVVGEQPLILPGRRFEYSSGTLLTTPVGTMRGYYTLRTDEGAEFDVAIPEFVLSIPRVLH